MTSHFSAARLVVPSDLGLNSPKVTEAITTSVLSTVSFVVLTDLLGFNALHTNAPIDGDLLEELIPRREESGPTTVPQGTV